MNIDAFEPDQPITCVFPNATFQVHATDDPDAPQEGTDIRIRGWLTTEKKNLFNQIVRTSTFDWEDGLSRWNGRVLNQHGQMFLVGGGDNTPVGRMLKHAFVEGEGMFGSGIIYKEIPSLLKRAVRDGTINALSIGFRVTEDGFKIHKKSRTVEITKGYLHEVSLVNVGANNEALFDVLNSANANNQVSIHEPKYFSLTWQGQQYLVNEKGELIDA